MARLLETVDSLAAQKVQRIQEELEQLYLERARLRSQKKGTAVIEHNIVELKRALRKGPQLNEGEVLADHYRLLDVIGKGGFGKVWQAFDRHACQIVAIKVLHNEQGDELRRLERFKRGALKMRDLNHAHIVRLLDGPDEYAGFHYFVMEYLPGSDLSRAIINKQLTQDMAVDTILQVGEALEYAHLSGLIHRDVKPQNILLDGNGRAKLTDFDLVWAPDTTGGTRTGAMGTFLYSAPEELDDASRIDARADIYSLGMSLLFVLHGRHLPQSAIFGRYQFIEQLSCPAELKPILHRATAFDPQERPRSMGEFCAALRSVTSSQDRGRKPILANRLTPAVISETSAATLVDSAQSVSVLRRSTDKVDQHSTRTWWSVAGMTLTSVLIVIIIAFSRWALFRQGASSQIIPASEKLGIVTRDEFIVPSQSADMAISALAAVPAIDVKSAVLEMENFKNNAVANKVRKNARNYSKRKPQQLAQSTPPLREVVVEQTPRGDNFKIVDNSSIKGSFNRLFKTPAVNLQKSVRPEKPKKDEGWIDPFAQ